MPSKRKTNGSMLQAQSKQDGAIVRQLARSVVSALPSKKKKGRKAGRNGGSGPRLSKYACSLLHPFSAHADGVRVPDPYAQPTVTFKALRTFAIGTDANGNLDFALMPRTDLMLWQTRGTATGLVDNRPTNCPAGIAIAGLNGYDAFASDYVSYRLVSYGIRIKSNLNWSNAQGRLVVARVPSPRNLPGAVVPAATTLAQMANAANIPNSAGLISTSIGQLPKAQMLTTAQLHAENGWEGIFHPTSAAALSFLDATRSVMESVTGTLVNYQDGYFSCDGWQSLVVYGEGLTAASVPSVLNLEVVYHFEGTPIISTGLVPSGQAVAVGNVGEAAGAHQMISSHPIGHTVREKMELVAHRGLSLAEKEAGKAISGAWRDFKSRRAARNVEMLSSIAGLAI